MKKLIVDSNKCIGCGACVTLCPKVFRLNEEAKAEVIDQNADNLENIQKAIDSCPTQAISWEGSEA